MSDCVTLCSLPGSSVLGILQARVLKWIAMPSSMGSSQPRDRTWVSWVSCFAGRFFTAEPTGKPYKLPPRGKYIETDAGRVFHGVGEVENGCSVGFSRVQLCDPVDCGLPGSSVHGILQARILEWAAMPSSRGSS